MEREYFEITTPIEKHIVKLKKWLTGGEKLALSKANNGDAEASSRAGVEQIAVGLSFDEFCTWHGQDFDYVLENIAKVVSDSSAPKAPSSVTTQA